MQKTRGKVIAYSGAHGTGKTTAVFGEAYRIKKLTSEDVGIVQEVARDCPLPIYSHNSVPTEAAQAWIFAEQTKREIDAAMKYGVVVSDRTVVDNIAYSFLFGFAELAYAHKAQANRHMKIYREIRFKQVSKNPYLKADGLRATDIDMQVRYEHVLLGLYDDLGVELVIE